MGDAFQLPFGSREERLAHNEAWSRSLNERRAEWLSAREEMAGFRCECWERDCPELVALTGDDWQKARAEPARFVVAPGHVAEGIEAVIQKHPRFWLVEKSGQAGEVARKLAATD